MKTIIKLFVFLGLMTSSSMASAIDLFGPSCKTASKEKKPDWVKTSGAINDSQSRYGFGFAKYRKKASYDALLKNARNVALSELAESLWVQVDSSTTTNASKNTGDKSVNQSFVKESKTSSIVELPDVKTLGVWQDRKTCDVYVLVHMPEYQANLISKKYVAMAYYDDAQDENNSIDQRLAAINNAMSMASNLEFGELSNSESSADLLRLFGVLRDDLMQAKNSRSNVVYVIGSDKTGFVSDKMMAELTARFTGVFFGGVCKSATMCLVKAQETLASNAFVIKVDFEPFKDRGFYLGNFILHASIWDVKNNAKKFDSKNNERFRNVRVMSRQKHQVNLVKGFEKWLASNPTALDELKIGLKKSQEVLN